MKKNTKGIIAVIMAAMIVSTAFTACSKNNNEPVNNDVSVTIKESNTNETVSSTEEQTSTTENTTEMTSNVETTTKQETTAKNVTTTKKVVTTTKKQAETTTKKKVTTTKKAVTTTKKTAPKQTTTKKAVKNVTVAEVQAQANAYLKSKGFTIDTSLRPNKSGWRGEISVLQEYLNDGTTLDSCRGYANTAYNECINSGYKAKEVAAYCYYGTSTEGGKALYILYLPGGGVFD